MHHMGREPQNPPLDTIKHIEVIVIPLLHMNSCFGVWWQCGLHDDLLFYGSGWGYDPQPYKSLPRVTWSNQEGKVIDSLVIVDQ